MVLQRKAEKFSTSMPTIVDTQYVKTRFQFLMLLFVSHMQSVLHADKRKTNTRMDNPEKDDRFIETKHSDYSSPKQRLHFRPQPVFLASALRIFQLNLHFVTHRTAELKYS